MGVGIGALPLSNNAMHLFLKYLQISAPLALYWQPNSGNGVTLLD